MTAASDSEYYGLIYYDDSMMIYRTVQFIITKNLQFQKMVEKEIETATCQYKFAVEFDEQKICLKLPSKIVGNGWEFLPSMTPLEINKNEVDSFKEGKRLPRCTFRILWISDKELTRHDQPINLIGARTPKSIIVECFYGMSSPRPQWLAFDRDPYWSQRSMQPLHLGGIPAANVPSPPTGLKADNVKTKSMTISWQPPHDVNGIIRGYQVKYTPHGERKNLHGVGNTIKAELTNLKPHTEYTIRVRAKTVRFGDYSTPITVTTPEDGDKMFCISSLWCAVVPLVLAVLIGIIANTATLTTDLGLQIKILSGEIKSYDWKDSGFKMDVPSDCLPEYIKECTLKVTASLATNISLPNNTELVSGVYHIVLPANVQRLNKPVTIYIEHCADLKPGEEDKLSFVVAKEGATTFEFLPGGVFSSEHNYGSINLDSFSEYAIAGSNMTYCGRVFYVNINPSNNYHEGDFVVTKKLGLALKTASRKYSSQEHIEYYFKLKAPENKVSLRIPETDDGWTLKAINDELTKDTIDNFDNHQQPPRLKLGIQKNKNNASCSINFNVYIKGTEDTEKKETKCAFLCIHLEPVPRDDKDDFYYGFIKDAPSYFKPLFYFLMNNAEENRGGSSVWTAILIICLGLLVTSGICISGAGCISCLKRIWNKCRGNA